MKRLEWQNELLGVEQELEIERLRQQMRTKPIDCNKIEAQDRYYCLKCGVLLRKGDFDLLSPIFPKSRNLEIPLCPKCHKPFKRSRKEQAINLFKKKGWVKT